MTATVVTGPAPAARFASGRRPPPRSAPRAATRAAASAPRSTPPATSVGKCMPRYSRETITNTGANTATTHATRRANGLRTLVVTIKARPTYSTTAAAVWPEGKLEVGGAASSRCTAGRARSTSIVVVRNTVTSSTSAVARNASVRQRRRTPRIATTTAAMPITVIVSATFDPTWVRSFAVALRWCSNQRLTWMSQSGRVVGEQHACQRPARGEQQHAQGDVRTRPRRSRRRRPASAPRAASRGATPDHPVAVRTDRRARSDEGGGSVRPRGGAAAPVAAPAPVDGFVITPRVFTASVLGQTW